MISDIAAWMFALFVVDPLHAELRERVGRANLPLETVQQSQQCITTHGPRLLQQAGEDPVGAVATAVGVATGWMSPIQLFDIKDPNCSVLADLYSTSTRGGDSES